MKKQWNWFEKTNKKEAIKNELQPLITEMISDDVQCLFISPQVGVILEECDNVFIVPNDEIIPHHENLTVEHFFNFYKNDEPIRVYIDRNKEDVEIIDFRGHKEIVNTLRIGSDGFFTKYSNKL